MSIPIILLVPMYRMYQFNKNVMLYYWIINDLRSAKIVYLHYTKGPCSHTLYYNDLRKINVPIIISIK